MLKKEHPIEWIGLLIVVLIYDIIVHRNGKRPTLSSAVKKLRSDRLVSSILWAFWGWLTYHWLVEPLD